MPPISELKEQLRDLSTKALAVVEDADRPTSEKREELDKIEADIKSVSERITDQEYLAEKRKAFQPEAGSEAVADEQTAPTATASRSMAKSIGQQFVEHDGYKNVLGLIGKGKIESGPIELKATVSEGVSGIVQPEVQPGFLPILFQRLTVADLMPNGATNSNTVRYLKETIATNAAAAVAEGGAKPASDLQFAQVDEPVRKIATVIKVTDEMLEDQAQIRSYIDGRLALFVQIAEEAQLTSGSGVAPQLTGILNRSGLTAAQAVGADTRLDAIYKEITKVRVASFLEPDSIVMHPTDWQTIRLLKDANNQYYAGGPFNYGPYGVGTNPSYNTITRSVPTDTLWGLRVVVTTAITAGTALLGAFMTAAQIFRRSGLVVEMTNSNEDDFKNNLVAIRAEERLALAVYRAAAFGTVTGL
ncbi:MAG: phage major capsid protein [Actinobacteria bacterium]|nr:phage major capsid protein [Actinomycetota bacterium]